MLITQLTSSYAIFDFIIYTENHIKRKHISMQWKGSMKVIESGGYSNLTHFKLYLIKD